MDMGFVLKIFALKNCNMQINICESYESLSLKAKNIIVSELSRHKDLMLCAATGSSPTKMYELFVDEAKTNPELFSELTLIKLDEWGNLPMNNEGTCESYIQKYLIRPLGIPQERYIAFQSKPENPERECLRVQKTLEAKGPIDICILGIGVNGHIALNEPSDYLDADCHVAYLTKESLKHPMLADSDEKPLYGITLGMANIMQSKLIILLISGTKKREIAKKLFDKRITTTLPASLLWLHPHVICLIDKEAAG